MNRIQQLEDIARECLKERFIDNQKIIAEYYQVHREDILNELWKLIKESVKENFEQGKKIKYVMFSILESSYLTKSYDIQLAFMDEKMYLDETPTRVYWRPTFVFSLVEKDMIFFRKMAAGSIIRIKEYEIQKIEKKYINEYYNTIIIFLNQTIPEMINNAVKMYGCFEKDYQVLIGRYMEKAIPLYSLEGER